MKIIVAGAGAVGSHLAKMLSQENHDIVLIDTDESKLRQVGGNLDLMTRTGSATSIDDFFIPPPLSAPRTLAVAIRDADVQQVLNS